MSGTVDPLVTLESVLGWARARDYRGYDYADGLSSPIRSLVPVTHDWLDIAIQETAKRAPVNVRPLMGVPRRRSYKGTGLFIQANLLAHDATGDDRYRAEAARLGRWLWSSRRRDPFGWGHNHRLQTLSGPVERNTPSVVTVTYASRGLMALGDHEKLVGTEALADAIERLFRDHLAYDESGAGATIEYRAGHRTDYTIVNANALGAGLLAELGAVVDRSELIEMAESLLRYVASTQTSRGGWRYADPPDASHLSMDNHHNGFVIESFLRYRAATGDDQFDPVIDRGLAFYRDDLFSPAGAPNWDERTPFPRDVHGAAQGIITFAMAGDPAFARRILSWTVDHLSVDGVRFYFRRGRWWTNRTTLMRWCQAWMAMASAALVDAEAFTRLPFRLEARG